MNRCARARGSLPRQRTRRRRSKLRHAGVDAPRAGGLSRESLQEQIRRQPIPNQGVRQSLDRIAIGSMPTRAPCSPCPRITSVTRDKAKTLVENLENGVKLDSKPDTSIVQRGAQSLIRLSSAPRTGAKTVSTGAGRTVASRRHRLRCVRCWRLIRRTNSSSRSPTG